jgi:hypothetical protein
LLSEAELGLGLFVARDFGWLGCCDLGKAGTFLKDTGDDFSVAAASETASASASVGLSNCQHVF